MVLCVSGSDEGEGEGWGEGTIEAMIALFVPEVWAVGVGGDVGVVGEELGFCGFGAQG